MSDPINNAIYDLVHDYPGGAPALADKYNTLKKLYQNHPMYSPAEMNPGTLQHKANKKMETHNLTLKEAVSLMFLTKDYRLLHTLAAELGFCCIEIRPVQDVSDIEFLNQFTSAMKEVGDMARVLHEAFEDKKITSHEVKAFYTETIEAISAISALPSRLEAMRDE